MQMQRNKSKAMPVILTLLVIATLITGVLAANSLLEMADNTPTTTISIPAITEKKVSNGSVSTVISDVEASASASAMAVSDTSVVAYQVSVSEYEDASAQANTSTAASVQTNATKVSYAQASLAATVSTEANTVTTGNTASPTLSAVSLDLLMEDGRTIWSGEKEVDIFSISYDNVAGETTVNSAYEDKVIAPGTSDQYLVYIENNGNAAVDYTLTAEGSASFTMDGETYTIPVEVRLTDSEKNYLVGSENEWTAVEELDTVSDSSVLSAGYYTAYTLDWRWLYEQDDTETGDAYDTMLGNLAASGETLAVTIRFTVNAANDEDENAIGGYPKTGDYQPIILWFVLMILLFIMFLYLLSNRKREPR